MEKYIEEAIAKAKRQNRFLNDGELQAVFSPHKQALAHLEVAESLLKNQLIDGAVQIDKYLIPALTQITGTFNQSPCGAVKALNY